MGDGSNGADDANTRAIVVAEVIVEIGVNERSDQIVIPDDQFAGFVFELNVLWFAAEHSMFENSIAPAQRSEPFDDRVRSNRATFTNYNFILDDGVGSNADIRRDLRRFANDGCGVNAHSDVTDTVSCRAN